MNLQSIDINCDLGEGIGNEALLMPYLSSCNIACGGHAGDQRIMKETVLLAMDNKTWIGAHPSFPDRKNFGRIEMQLPPDQLFDIIYDQVNRLLKIIDNCGGKLSHIKPHGALYNLAAVNEETAEVITKVTKAFGQDIFLYSPYDSVISKLAQQKNITVKYEAFADRNYNDDLTLVSRKEKNATLHDVDEIFDHVMRMIKENKVKTINGKIENIIADTLCIHGDNPQALEIVSALHQKLTDNHIGIEKIGQK